MDMESSNIMTFAHSPCIIGGLQTSSGTYRPVTVSDYAESNAPYDFNGVIPNISGASYTLDNPSYSTIGVRLISSSGVNIGFYGTFDGIEYSPITLRQLSDDGYTQIDYWSSGSDGSHDYIGSIASLRAVKFTALNTGVSGASVGGRLSVPVSTLEGVENNAAPHKFGNAPFHKGIFVNNTTGSGILVYQPPSGRKFIITDYCLSIFAGGANVTLYEDGNDSNTDSWLTSVYVKTTANDVKIINMNFSTPFVSSAVNYPLRISVDSTATVRGVVQGYYTL